MYYVGAIDLKEEYLYSAFYILCISQSAQAWITQFYLQIHHTCLSFVSVHQMAPPLTKVRDIQLQLTTRLSTPKGWKSELAWLVDLWRTVYPHKWSPISYRSSAGQAKFAGQRPTFYHRAMQPTRLLFDRLLLFFIPCIYFCEFAWSFCRRV